MKGTYKDKNIEKIILWISLFIIFTTFILDKSNYVAQGFAFVFTVIIYKKYSETPRELYFYITLLYSIIGSMLTIRLESLIGINQDLHIYYLYLGGYTFIILNDLIKSYDNIKYNIIKFVKKPINLLYIAFFLYVYISFFIANNKSLSIKRLVIYSIMGIFTVMVIKENNTKEKLSKTVNIIMKIGVAILVLGLFKILTGIQIEAYSHYTPKYGTLHNMSSPYNRIPTIFYFNPNDFVIIAVLMLVVYAVKFIYANTNKERLIFMSVIILAQVNVFFSRSRTGWIATIASLAFLIVYLLIKMRWKSVFRAILCFAAVLITFNLTLRMPNLDEFTEKITEIAKSGISIKDKNSESDSKNQSEKTEGSNDRVEIEIGSYGSINVRATLVLNTLDSVFKEKNIIGVGVGNSTQYMMDKANTFEIYDVHNWWLEVLLEYGVIGFIIFVAFYGFMALKFMIYDKNNNEKESYSNVMALMSLAALSMLIFGPSSVVAFIPFWLTLALCFSQSNIINKELEG